MLIVAESLFAKFLTGVLIRKRSSYALKLAHYGVGDKLGRALVRSLAAPAGPGGGASFGRTIRDLDVSDCRLADGSLAALTEAAAAHCPTLRSLRLAHNGKGAVGPRCCEAVAKLVTARHTVQILSLAGGGMRDRDFKKIAGEIKKKGGTRLTYLDVSNNRLGVDGGWALAKILASEATLTEVDASQNMIRGTGAVAVAKALAKTVALRVCRLHANNFGSYGGIAAGHALEENEGLEYLDLGDNSLCTVAGETLAYGFVQSASLSVLRLEGNPLGVDGARAVLRSAIVRGTYCEISLMRCPMDRRARPSPVAALADAHAACKQVNPADPAGEFMELNLGDVCQRNVALGLLQLVRSRPRELSLADGSVVLDGEPLPLLLEKFTTTVRLPVRPPTSHNMGAPSLAEVQKKQRRERKARLVHPFFPLLF